MFKVYNSIDKTELEYEYVEDILRDIVDDDDVEEWINEIYPPADVEGFKFQVGTIYRRCGSEEFWNDVVEDWIRSESDYIEDELWASGEYEGYGLRIVKLDFEKDEDN